MTEDEDKTIYKVVVNDEEQYSIWPEYRENPAGWSDVGKVGPKAECGIHQGSLDGYAAAESQEEDGRDGEESAASAVA